MRTKKRVSSGLVLLIVIILWSTGIGQANRLVDMEFKSAPLTDVYQILGEIAGYNVLLDPSVTGEVSFYLKDLTVDESLDLVSRTTGFGYKVVGNTLVVASPERLRREFSSQQFSFVYLEHVRVSYAEQLLSMIVPDVRVYSDAERNLVVLYGDQDHIELAEDVLSQYDTATVAQELQVARPLDESESVALRIPVQYGDGEEMVNSLQSAYPEYEFSWEARAGIVVANVTANKRQEIEALIHRQDVPNFGLKGMLSSGERRLVLVEYRGRTQLLEEGQALADWTLIDIKDREVTFAKQDRQFNVTMGR